MTTAPPHHVLIVGASSGIGRETAKRFKSAGAQVTAIDIKPPSDPELAFVECDLADKGSIDVALDQLTGPWDAVIHVAGIPGTAPDDAVYAVNFLGLREFLTRVTPNVRRGGSVVVIASTAGAAWPGKIAELSQLLSTNSFEDGSAWFRAHHDDKYPAYNLSKEAAIAFVKQFSARAWREFGVRVNSVSPGPVDTPILKDFKTSMGEGNLEAIRGLVGRFGAVDDIAPVIEFLTSADAKWVIGQDMQVDGGFTAALSAGAYGPEDFAAVMP